MKRIALFFVISILLIPMVSAQQQNTCVSCHQLQTPGIVQDWMKSKHYKAGVDCYTCHQAKEGDYKIEHHGFLITPIVSPKKCGACHEYEYITNSKSKHAFAAVNGPLLPWYKAMKKKGLNPFDANTAKEYPPEDYIRKLVTPLYPSSGVLAKIDIYNRTKGRLFTNMSYQHANQFLGCMECHGSFVYEGKDGKLHGWPNVGVGRINPDGSLGSCVSCHSAHQFDIAEARKPETCGKCHLGPDHPQIEIYEQSYHGARYENDGKNWNWHAKPWKVGKDFSAPTCAACHMSELATPDGRVIVRGTHDVGDRLKWEIQGKFVTYQSAVSNKAEGYKPDEKLAKENRERMRKVCLACHSPNWVDNYFKAYEKVLNDYNMIATYAKELLDKMYAEGLIDKSNPIDEEPEIMWYYIWHHDGRRWRMGAAMMGPDYTHWNGALDTIMNKLGYMIDWYETHKKLRGESPKLTTSACNNCNDDTKETDEPNYTPHVALATFGLISVGLFLTRKLR